MTLQSHGTALDRDDPIGREIRELAPWFHNLHLPDGWETAPDHPLGDFPAVKWAQIGPALPEDLRGKRVLDVGCNAGFYSFALAGRGARVLGIDSDEHYLRQARWARGRLGLPDEQVSFERMQVYELAQLDGTFDLVLFLGVLYHLRYPLLALDLVAQKVGELLVLQTLSLPGEEVAEPPEDLPIDQRETLRTEGWPTMAFVERKLAGDPTNWWVPNRACVEALLRSAGLEPVSRPGHEIWLARPGEAKPPPELRAVFPGSG